MKNIPFPLDYQQTLIYAGLDNLSPVDMLTGVGGGQSGVNSADWKRSAVEFIVENLKAGLIEGFPPQNSGFDFSNARKIGAILENSDPNQDPKIWMGMQFTGTDELNNILSACGLVGWNSIHEKINEELLTALREKYGAPSVGD